MACCVSTVLSGSGKSVRARSVRATPARVGSRPATKAPRSKGLWSGSSLQRGLESLPELTCRCRHKGVLGHSGGSGIQLARVGEEQAQQRRLRRLQGALHGTRIERVGLGRDGLEVDA